MQASQHWQADQYQRHAAFVAAHGEAALDWLGAQAGERILDLGCGDGVLMQQLATAGVKVAGIDGSAAMVAAAQARGIELPVWTRGNWHSTANSTPYFPMPSCIGYRRRRLFWLAYIVP